MPLKRRFDRYRTGSPIVVETDRGNFAVVPGDISAGGCFARSRPPWPSEAEIRSVSIPIDGGEEIQCVANLFERGSPRPRHQRFAAGFGLEWKLEPTSAKQLDAHLRSAGSGPSADLKVEYIISEQQSIISEVQEIERAKFKRTQFTLALIVAYLAYLVAPYTLLNQLNIELAVFYALGGFWASMAILVQSDRYLNFLGAVSRQKAVLRKAFNANRAYVLGRDPSYYGVTVLPVGLTYDRSRVWTSSKNPKVQSAEAYPGTAQYSSFYPTLYVLFLQVMFLAGAVHFLGLVMRAIDGVSLASTTTGPNLFDEKYFLHSFVANVWLVLAWIQFSGNTCIHFHRAVWEGKHIAVHRPNPRATGEALWMQHGAKPLRLFFLALFGGYAVVSLAKWIPAARMGIGVFSHWSAWHLLSPGAALFMVSLFFVTKLVYVQLSLLYERDSYWGAEPAS